MNDININGGTTVYAGLKTGIDMFDNHQVKNPEKNRQKRILFLTDMLDMNGKMLFLIFFFFYMTNFF